MLAEDIHVVAWGGSGYSPLSAACLNLFERNACASPSLLLVDVSVQWNWTERRQSPLYLGPLGRVDPCGKGTRRS